MKGFDFTNNSINVLLNYDDPYYRYFPGDLRLPIVMVSVPPLFLRQEKQISLKFDQNCLDSIENVRRILAQEKSIILEHRIHDGTFEALLCKLSDDILQKEQFFDAKFKPNNTEFRIYLPKLRIIVKL